MKYYKKKTGRKGKFLRKVVNLKDYLSASKIWHLWGSLFYGKIKIRSNH